MGGDSGKGSEIERERERERERRVADRVSVSSY